MDTAVTQARGKGVVGYLDGGPDEYVFMMETDCDGQWRAIVGGICYPGFETRLEALIFVNIKKTELLANHLGLKV